MYWLHELYRDAIVNAVCATTRSAGHADHTASTPVSARYLSSAQRCNFQTPVDFLLRLLVVQVNGGKIV